jgi:hypothetical protein
MTKDAERAGAARAAAALRADPPRLDELARARLERRIVEAALREARPEPASSRGQRPARCGPPASRWLWTAGAVAAAAALAYAGRGVLDGPAAPHGRPTAGASEDGRGPAGMAVRAEPAPGATDDRGPAAPLAAIFEGIEGAQPVRRGRFVEGEEVSTQPGQRVRVAFDGSRVEVGAASRARFDRLREDEVRVSLDAGRVDVAFHPRERGRQAMVVETRVARVEVVGTEFVVEVGPGGDTEVRVSEGRVRVVPRDGSAERFVDAGAVTRVPSVEGSEAPRPEPRRPQGSGPSWQAQVSAACDTYDRAALTRLAEAPAAPGPVRAAAANCLGDLALGARDDATAVRLFATACDGGLAEACFSLGGRRRALGDAPGARSAFARCVQLAPAGPHRAAAERALAELEGR